MVFVYFICILLSLLIKPHLGITSYKPNDIRTTKIPRCTNVTFIDGRKEYRSTADLEPFTLILGYE